MKKIINYSGIPGLILLATLAFMPFSCSKEAVKENPDADNSSQLIKISGEDASAATKTTLVGLVTSWKAGDKVGIYSPDARPTSGAAAGVVNRQFSANTAGFSSTFTAIAGNEMYWGITNPHLFYAYYPYSASAGANATVVPISLKASQTQSAGDNNNHIGALDFLVATPVSKTAGFENASTTVDLRYNHVFSILEFQIKRSSGSGKITRVKLTAPATNLSLTSGTIDITQATYAINSGSTGTNEITLTITDGVTPTADYGSTPKIYMMILPGDFNGQSMTIGMEYESSGVFENTAKTGKIFERGKKYVVQMDVTSPTVTDVDNNVYNTIRIGTQVWMASNLKTTKYNDNSAILNVTDNTIWAGRTEGAYCWYGNDAATYKATYGALYNWYAVNTAKLCPVGWRVPTDAEWTTLTTNLGGESVAGNELKEAGTTHWISNTAATNSSGFTALPGGDRYDNGTFDNIGYDGYWWSSTEYSMSNAWGRDVYCGYSGVSRYGYGEKGGFSVRCLRDF